MRKLVWGGNSTLQHFGKNIYIVRDNMGVEHAWEVDNTHYITMHIDVDAGVKPA